MRTKNKPDRRKTSRQHTMKIPYTAEGTKCKECNKGRLRPAQWNRYGCSNDKCANTELM